MNQFYSTSFGQNSTILNPHYENITELGAIGEFISGNFYANIQDGASTKNAIANFRIRRTF